MEKHAQAERKRVERERLLAQRKEQRARNEGLAWQYFLKQKRKETRLVFVGGAQRETTGVIRSILPYHFWLELANAPCTARAAQSEDPAREKVEKLTLLMCFKADSADRIRTALSRDDSVAAMALSPLRDRTQRYAIPSDVVQRAQEDGARLRATLCDGTVLEGTVDWHSALYTKLNVTGGDSVVMFHHGVHRIEMADPSGDRVR